MTIPIVEPPSLANPVPLFGDIRDTPPLPTFSGLTLRHGPGEFVRLASPRGEVWILCDAGPCWLLWPVVGNAVPPFSVRKGEESLYGSLQCERSGTVGTPDFEAVEYAAFVASRVKDGERIRSELTAEDCHIWHMATGVAGEGGEVLDAVKKGAVYRKGYDRQNIVEELGDLEFFMEGLRKALQITRAETLKANVEKLSARYKKAYSDAQAQLRADKALYACPVCSFEWEAAAEGSKVKSCPKCGATGRFFKDEKPEPEGEEA